jgi:hypothetical protein
MLMVTPGRHVEGLSELLMACRAAVARVSVVRAGGPRRCARANASERGTDAFLVSPHQAARMDTLLGLVGDG